MKHSHIVLAALAAVSGHAHAGQGWTEIDDESLLVEPLGMTVGELDGVALFGSSGERIGELDDVLLGQDGSSMAVSLDVGGFLGIGERDVAIPVSELTRTEDGFMVDMSKEQLEALPEHDD